MEFSTELPNEWKDVLSERSIERLRSAQQKIVFTILDINAYYYTVEKMSSSYQDWIKPLFEGQTVSGPKRYYVDFCSTDVPVDNFLEKVNFNFYTSAHSFFDNYAQFICSCLFPIRPEFEKYYLYNVCSELEKNVSYKTILDAIYKFTQNNNVYQYIVDIDNYGKHRHSVSPIVTTWLNDGEITTELPDFKKDGRPHCKSKMEDSLENTLELCINFYQTVTPLVIDYLEQTK